MIAASIVAAIFASFDLSGVRNAAIHPQFYMANALGLIKDHLFLRVGIFCACFSISGGTGWRQAQIPDVPRAAF